MNVINEPGIENSAFTFQRVGWVEMISNNIPAHCEDIKVNLQQAFSEDIPIDQVDAYACALTTAIAVMNGELAFEMEMDDVLRGKAEREAAKTAASLAALMATHLDASDSLDGPATEFSLGEWKNTVEVDEIKVGMYVYAAAVALRSKPLILEYSNLLQAAGVTVEQLRAIIKIASVTAAINKIAV